MRSRAKHLGRLEIEPFDPGIIHACQAGSYECGAVLHVKNAFVPGGLGGRRTTDGRESARVVFECEQGHRVQWVFTEHSGVICVDGERLPDNALVGEELAEGTWYAREPTSCE
jgi:hypothetical protein